MRIACLGDRNLDDVEIRICELVGKQLALKGHEIISGNTRGAEQAFARGFATVNPESCTIILPWMSFEIDAFIPGTNKVIFNSRSHRGWEIVYEKFRPDYKDLTPALQKVFSRYVGILNMADFVVLWSMVKDPGKQYEDSLFIVEKMAHALNKPVIDLRNKIARQAFFEKIGLVLNKPE
jgi:hypothetical protein